jgi:hypothetical protein
MHEPRQDTAPTAATGLQSEAGVGLEVARRVLNIFDREGIAYCHWKSNEHLAEGLLGITDLDLLFDRLASLKLARALSEAGFKRFQPTAPRLYPGMEDYIGLDGETGKLIHIHAHYELRLGEKNAKGYRLPWEKHFLERRYLQMPEAAFVPQPELEMIVFLVRGSETGGQVLCRGGNGS